MVILRLAVILAVVGACSTALATSRIVDGNIVCSGKITTSAGAGGTTCVIGDALGGVGTEPVFQSRESTPFTESDINNSAIVLTAGTGASATTQYKITDYDSTTNTVTISSLNGSTGTFPAIDNTTEYIIYWGCDYNTQTTSVGVHSSTTGPKLTIQGAYSGTGTASGVTIAADIIYVRYSNTPYTESRQAINTGYVNISSSAQTGFIISGFRNTLGDIDQPSSTGSTMDTTYFPVIRPAHATNCVVIDSSYDPPSGQVGLLGFRNLKIQHAGASSRIISNAHNATTTYSSRDGMLFRFNNCVIGNADGTDQSGYYEQTTSGGGKSAWNDRPKGKAVSFNSCAFNTTGPNIYAGCNRSIRVDSCLMRMAFVDGGSAYDQIYILTSTSSLANHVYRVAIIDSDIESTTTGGTSDNASCVAVRGSSSNDGPNLCEHISILGNRIYNRQKGAVVAIGSAPSLDISNNLIYSDNTSGGALISLYPDASAATRPGFFPRERVILKNVAGASSSANTIELTGGDGSTNNIYKYLAVRKYAALAATATETRMIAAYDASSKIATVSPDWAVNPVAGDVFEVIQDIPRVCRVYNNWCEIKNQTIFNGHGILVGQGFDNAVVTHNTVLNSDYGLVIKGEHGVYSYNKVFSTAGAVIIKGGSFNTLTYNSCVLGTNIASGSGGALGFVDVSSPLLGGSGTGGTATNASNSVFDDAAVSDWTARAAINDVLVISSGTNAAPGSYSISAVSADTITLVGNATNGAGNASSVVWSISTVTPTLHHVNYSKTTGNIVTDNIFCTLRPGRYVILDGAYASRNAWASFNTLGPAMQWNIVDRNVYWTDTNEDGAQDGTLFSVNNNTYTTISDLRTAWDSNVMPTSLSTTVTGDLIYAPTRRNDVNSVVANPGLSAAAASVGNFAISRASPAWGRGAGGSNIGSYQPTGSGGSVHVRADDQPCPGK